MKLTLIVALAIFFSYSSLAQTVLPMGSHLPKDGIRMKDVMGELVSFNDVKTSSGLLVMFSSNTCPYVIRNHARTKEICNYSQEKNIGVILLNANERNRSSGDSYADMQQYARQQGYQWKYAIDSHNELADALGANHNPECFLFDGNGILVYHGAIDNNPADGKSVSRRHLKIAIDEMLSGKKISLNETRSVGCTIQRKRTL